MCPTGGSGGPGTSAHRSEPVRGGIPNAVTTQIRHALARGPEWIVAALSVPEVGVGGWISDEPAPAFLAGRGFIEYGAGS